MSAVCWLFLLRALMLRSYLITIARRPKLRQNHVSRGRENVDVHMDWQTENKLVEF